MSRLASGKVRKRILARLDDRGVLAAERSRFLGLVPRAVESVTDATTAAMIAATTASAAGAAGSS